jgi:3-deoxy-D-manno-octulosonic-acid transferase
MRIFYNIFISLYRLALFLLSPFNEKAALWYRGRKGFFRKWREFDAGGRKVIWFHCASLGEFEQGQPVIEEIRKRQGNIFILLTFFSPSGYEIRKNNPIADAVCYLPSDTPSNARRFIDTFRPEMAVFVKYEFWYNYISTLNRNKIPLYLISSNFRQSQIFFRWYGRWFSRILHKFNHIFVQNEDSVELLKSVGVNQVSVSGDTRFDRVYAIASATSVIPAVADFSEGVFTIVAGSTWPPDHSLWVRYMNETRHNVKLIIAPHEINENEVSELANQFTLPVIRFSLSDRADLKTARILVIDNIGMLSSLYSYGSLAYIGGGFGKNIHNILEACVFSVPVIFGPKYFNFREALELVSLGGAFAVDGYDGFSRRVDEMVVNNSTLIKAGNTAGLYVKSGTGASSFIVDNIMIS